MRMTDVLGGGLTYEDLSRGTVLCDERFLHTIEDIRDTFPDVAAQVCDLLELSQDLFPYERWTFHRVPDGRWVARRVLDRDTAPIFLEYCDGDWSKDEDRLYAVHSDLGFLRVP